MDKQLIKGSIVGLIIMMLFAMTVQGITNSESYAGNQLRILGILKGYPDGSLKLDTSIKRSEVAALTVRMLGYELEDVLGDDPSFIDVSPDYWGYNVINKAYKLKVIQGYPDKSFKPLGQITYAEVVAIMVNTLKEQEDIEGVWPDNYIEKGRSIGIIPKDSQVLPNKIVTRGEMAVIIWDTLLVQ